MNYLPKELDALKERVAGDRTYLAAPVTATLFKLIEDLEESRRHEAIWRGAMGRVSEHVLRAMRWSARWKAAAKDNRSGLRHACTELNAIEAFDGRLVDERL